MQAQRTAGGSTLPPVSRRRSGRTPPVFAVAGNLDPPRHPRRHARVSGASTPARWQAVRHLGHYLGHCSRVCEHPHTRRVAYIENMLVYFLSFRLCVVIMLIGACNPMLCGVPDLHHQAAATGRARKDAVMQGHRHRRRRRRLHARRSCRRRAAPSSAASGTGPTARCRKVW